MNESRIQECLKCLGRGFRVNKGFLESRDQLSDFGVTDDFTKLF